MNDREFLQKFGYAVEVQATYRVTGATGIVLASSVIDAESAEAKAAFGLRRIIEGRAADGSLIPPKPFAQS